MNRNRWNHITLRCGLHKLDQCLQSMHRAHISVGLDYGFFSCYRQGVALVLADALHCLSGRGDTYLQRRCSKDTSSFMTKVGLELDPPNGARNCGFKAGIMRAWRCDFERGLQGQRT